MICLYLQTTKKPFKPLPVVLRRHCTLVRSLNTDNSNREKWFSTFSNAGDPGLIPGLGRPPGEGNGYPVQYSGLENSMHCIVHGAAKSWTQQSNLHFSLSGNKTQSLIKENQGRMSKKLDFSQQISTCLLSGEIENNTSRINSVCLPG